MIISNYSYNVILSTFWNSVTVWLCCPTTEVYLIIQPLSITYRYIPYYIVLVLWFKPHMNYDYVDRSRGYVRLYQPSNIMVFFINYRFTFSPNDFYCPPRSDDKYKNVDFVFCVCVLRFPLAAVAPRAHTSLVRRRKWHFSKPQPNGRNIKNSWVSATVLYVCTQAIEVFKSRRVWPTC